MVELEPCPFCVCCETDDEPMHHTLDCYLTLATIQTFAPISYSQDKLRKAWNTRHERTCENEYGNATTSFKCSTCSCAVESNDYYYSDVNISNGDFNYCPNCGAKVV